MNIIIYQNDGLKILIPSENCGLSLDEIIAKDIPQNCYYKIMNNNDLPEDTYFRDSWEFDISNNIVINLNKAKDIWKNTIRINRQQFLEILDVAYFRAIETNNEIEMQSIANRKQILRDATKDPRFDLAQNTEDLKKIYNLEELSKV